jgi:FimV-like protein
MSKIIKLITCLLLLYASSAFSTGISYEVKKGDTLWAISKDIAEQHDQNIFQVMFVIQKMNQNAFIQKNINLLLAESMLQLPTLHDIEKELLSQEVLLSEMIRQNAEWESYKNSRVQKLQPPSSSTSSAAEKASQTKEQQSEGTTETSNSKKEVERLKILADDLATQESAVLRESENIESKKLEVSEMRSRLQNLEELLNKQTNVIALQSNQLLKLKDKLNLAKTQKKRPLKTTEEDTQRDSIKKYFFTPEPYLLSLLILLFFVALLWKQKVPGMYVTESSYEESSLLDREEDIDVMDTVDASHQSTTLLNLAHVYIEMKNSDKAKSVLEQVLSIGSPDDVAEAKDLISKLKKLRSSD